jgi:hypothetical protein
MMRHPISNGVFEPKLTTGEKKTASTNRAARQIIDRERSAREAKSQRLRQARLAKEQAEPVGTSAKTRMGNRKTIS